MSAAAQIIPRDHEPFFLLEKFDQFQGIATGIATSETVDRENEVLNYTKSKPYFQAWSESVNKDSGGKSFGNVRLQHDDKKVVGKLNSIEFNDAAKFIRVEAKIIDPVARELLSEGALTGFSIGGSYIDRVKRADGITEYVADPCEISVVDRPALPQASFQSVKSDGTIELKKFLKVAAPPEEEQKCDKCGMAKSECKCEMSAKAIRYLVPDGQHLPVTDEAGKPSHSHMGAAWAALHGGYRGNKYEGADKDKAIAALTALYHSEGLPLPNSTKAIENHIDELTESLKNAGAADIQSLTVRMSELLDSIAKAIPEAGMADENKDVLTLDKAARHTVHQKIAAAKSHVNAFLDNTQKACATMHGHLDGIAKVMGGGPESMDEGGKPNESTEGKSPSGSPAMAPGASDTADKGVKYVEVGKDDKGDPIFKRAADIKAATPEDIGRSVVKTMLQIQKDAQDAVDKAIGDRNKVRPFVKAATKEADAGGAGGNDLEKNLEMTDDDWKKYAQGDPKAIHKAQLRTGLKWQEVPARIMNRHGA